MDNFKLSSTAAWQTNLEEVRQLTKGKTPSEILQIIVLLTNDLRIIEEKQHYLNSFQFHFKIGMEPRARARAVELRAVIFRTRDEAILQNQRMISTENIKRSHGFDLLGLEKKKMIGDLLEEAMK